MKIYGEYILKLVGRQLNDSRQVFRPADQKSPASVMARAEFHNRQLNLNQLKSDTWWSASTGS